MDSKEYLSKIVESEDSLHLALKTLQQFLVDLKALPKDSTEYKLNFALIIEGHISLSAATTVLAIEKARSGIIGKTWYKENGSGEGEHEVRV